MRRAERRRRCPYASPPCAPEPGMTQTTKNRRPREGPAWIAKTGDSNQTDGGFASAHNVMEGSAARIRASSTAHPSCVSTACESK